MPETKRKVSVLYYDHYSLQLKCEVLTAAIRPQGRVVIPQAFKVNKSIIVVCEGEINIFNRLGDRTLSADHQKLKRNIN